MNEILKKKKSVLLIVHNFTHFHRFSCNNYQYITFESNTLMNFLTKIRKFESVTRTRRVYSLGRF